MLGDPWGAELNGEHVKVGHPKTLQLLGKRKMLAISLTSTQPIDHRDPK